MRWTKPARRCPTEHARRWDSETALRATRRGKIHPKDRQGPGGLGELGAKVPEVASGAQSQAETAQRVEAGPVQGVPPAASGGRIRQLRSALRELRAQGYTGGYSMTEGYVHPFRRKHQADATMRFETEPGEQAQVDWGSFSYVTEDGHKRQVWALVMVLSWSWGRVR